MNKVSVVVCTYTEEMVDFVLSCLRSLRRQTLQPYEIILVLDPNETLVNFYKSKIPDGVKIVVGEGFGLFFARNAGVKNSKGDIVAFIDDDAVADKHWLENLVKNYSDPHVVGVGGIIKPLWQISRPLWFPEELYWVLGCSYKGLPEHKASVRNPIGCNMSFRKSVFEKIGYFSSDIGRFGKKLLSCEETELSIRALGKIQGSKIVYDPLAVVHHRIGKSRASLKYVLARSFYEGVSKALVTFKSNSSTISSTEEPYLKYLLKSAVPSRLKRIYRFENLSQLLVLFLSAFTVITAFLLTRFGGVVEKQ